MALQPGDVIAFAKLAWDVYQLGWSDDCNAARQYLEFGRDVRSFASSLDILAKVVTHAHNSLVVSSPTILSLSSPSTAGPPTTALRWDPPSLVEIVGDYEETLRECRALLHENRRYEGPVNPARTLKWNVFVQPTVDRLRARIQLHNSKVLHVVKPLEIDLLSRIRQDIERMHAQIGSQVRAMHSDLRRLIGVLVPDLEHELHLQTRRSIELIAVPEAVARRFAQRATEPDLCELADAFVTHWESSTVRFAGGLLVETRIPPVETWLALLKCVWLMERMRTRVESAPDGSHWPSYVRQLEDELSAQCRRVGSEVVPPDPLAIEQAPVEFFEIWPRAPLPELVEVVTQETCMELVLELPLRSSSSVERSVKLFRRRPADQSPRRFRVVVTGIDRSTSRTQTETLDFDPWSARLNPLYASPSPSVFSVPEIVLRKDERIARLAFNDMRDLLRFQQGVTGYQAWAGTCCYNVVANFVIANRKEPVVEKACVQLWRHKPLPSIASPVEAPSLPLPPSPAGSVSFSASLFGQGAATRRDSVSVGSPFSGRPTWSSDVSAALGLSSSPPLAIPTRTSTITGLPYSTSPPRRPTFSTPVASPRGTVQSLAAPIPSPAPSHPRSMSLSSGSSAPALSVRSASSAASDSYTVPLSVGKYTGTLYVAPPHPVLVIFTQSPAGKPAIVAVRVDQDAAVNPERCNCRQSGRAGSECPITALERNKGRDKLVARRFESRNDAEWPLAELSAALADGTAWRPDDEWKNLVRVSLLFENGAKDRAVFGGTPSECRCKAKRDGELLACLKAGHGGLYGEVRELRRRQMLEYHEAKSETQRHNLVHGRREG